MKFSSQEEYGLRCLAAIARRGVGGSMTIPELAQSEGLSQPHVGKLMSVLRSAGFVSSTRGQVGGYSLNRKPTEIALGDVLAALGGRLYTEGFCERHSGVLDRCIHESDCNLRSMWGRVQEAVDGVVGQMTLQALLDPPTISRESLAKATR
ncbi:MAG: Rrf2 family transcriptional regulator [Fimbriimonadaceae bacterium]|nr:Rrf2 family transcriptional regulator [Fimbriimonadaceae bacterium]MCC7101711.1 Rrf2 family transcriptional regulator [Fimbriimonadaceae bacterium]